MKGVSLVDILNTLVEERNRAHKAGLDITLAAASEGRSLTAEERESVARTDADYNAKQELIENLRSAEVRTRQAEAEMERNEELRSMAPADSQPVEDVAAILRSLAKGERRSHTFEVRANSKGTTTDGGFTIPQGFGGKVIEKMLTVGPCLDPNVVNLIRTDTNADIPFPIENARANGTATAEAAVFGDSSPTFSQKTLKAYKYGTIVLASEELLNSEDAGLQDYLARNMGVAVGTAVNSILTLGTAGNVPEGVSHAAGSGVTGSTAVAGVPTYENLVDLVHSVDSLYASQPSTGFMLRRSTLGSIRKIKDGNGTYIFVPAANQSMPSTLLGYSVYENPYVAAVGTAAKSILFGDFSYFLVRQVGGVEVSRTNDRYWDTDQVGLKVRTWVDSFLGQSEAVKYYLGGAS
jgi:HK97 family phage major capsid protein